MLIFILILVAIALLSRTLYWRTLPLLIIAFLFTLAHVLQAELSQAVLGLWILFLLVLGAIIALLTPVVQLIFFKKDKRAVVPKSINVLYQPKGHAELDIVAVHGLGSDPGRAWVHKGTGKLWLSDFLPIDLPNARVLTFNHDTDWESDTPQESLRGYGNDLLKELGRFREKVEERNRPVIFIGYSFGGTIIKKALVIASENSDRKQLKDSFGGVIFLGTPHEGSSASSIGPFKALATYWLGSKTDLLVFSQPGGSENTDLKKQYQAAYPEIEHCDIYETKDEILPICGIDIPIGRVVPESSAVLNMPKSVSASMDLRHRELSKFGSIEDKNYQKLKGEIVEMWKRVRDERRAPRRDAGSKSFLSGPTTAARGESSTYSQPRPSSFLDGPTTAGRGAFMSGRN